MGKKIELEVFSHHKTDNEVNKEASYLVNIQNSREKLELPVSYW